MRLAVIGTSGAGKTTFARQAAARLGCPHVELDALHWMPGWQERPVEELQTLAASATAGPCWVVDGNYSSVREIVWSRATTIVWLDFSRATILRRIIWRTLKRVLTREQLWNGNRENLRALFSKESMILWSFNTFAKNRRIYTALQGSNRYPGLHWHILRSPRAAQAFLAGLRR